MPARRARKRWPGLAESGISLVVIAVGLVGATALARSIASQMYGISATDPFTYAAAAIIVLLTASAASFVPAVRAAHADVNQALRHR